MCILLVNQRNCRRKGFLLILRMGWILPFASKPLFCCCSVAKSCLTLCKPTDCSTLGFPVPHHLPDFAQVHVHWIGDAIQPSHPLSPSSPSAFNLSQHQGFFPVRLLFATGGSIGASASASILPMSIQGWFPSRLTGLISLLSKVSQESSLAPQFKSINSLALCLLYGPAFASVHDYWKDHSLD